MFIDFKTAYDSIIRQQLYEAMGKLESPSKLIRLVTWTMAKTRCRVKIQGNISELINVYKDLKQGNLLACLLFNIALERVIRDVRIQIEELYLTN